MAHGVYVPEIIKFYGCIQVLQAMAPFNLVHPVYDMLCCSGHKYIYCTLQTVYTLVIIHAKIY